MMPDRLEEVRGQSSINLDLIPGMGEEEENRFVSPHTGENIPVLRAGTPTTLFEGVKNYLFAPRPKTTPLELEAVEIGKTPYQVRKEIFDVGPEREYQYVMGRFLNSAAFGVPDFLERVMNGTTPEPETMIGAVAGAGADLGGFIIGGPYQLGSKIVGSRLAPTLEGLNTVGKILIDGGAKLGLASGLSSIAPSIMENKDIGDTATSIFHSTALGTLTGMIFPAMGVVPNKALRIATTLAVLDKMRAGWGQWFTIDDTVRGIKDGTIDNKDLAKSAFGYLMDIYFSSRTPTMAVQMAAWKEHEVLGELSRLGPADPQHAMETLIQKDPLFRSLVNGVTEWDIKNFFGGQEAFDRAFAPIKNERGAIGLEKPEETPSDSQRAEKVEKLFNEGDAELLTMRHKDFKDLRSSLVRIALDTSGNVKRELLDTVGPLGKEAVIKKDVIAGATSAGIQRTEQGQKKIGYPDLSKEDEITLNRIIEIRRTIKIEELKKTGQMDLFSDPDDPALMHRGGMTEEDGRAYLRVLESADPERYAKLNDVADRYYEYMNDLWKMRHDEGITSDDHFKRFDGIIYSPRWFIQHLEDTNQGMYGRLISITNTGVKALDEGSTRAMENNSRLLMAHQTNTLYNQVFRNRANKALYQVAKNNPENGIVQDWPKVQDENGNWVKKEAPAGFERISYMEKGEPVDMIMPAELAKEWVTRDPWINDQLARIIGWASGKNILQAMATGYNPEFAITNIPVDALHIWLTTQEYSPVIPKFAVDFAQDLKEVFPDVMTRSGAYVDYINEGGGMEFLTGQGRLTKDVRTEGQFDETMQTAADTLAWTGNQSELWTRLALRHRAIKNGKAPHEATWIARNYMDFNQGGAATKAANTAIPYLNAAFVATRGLGRAAKANPGLFTVKVAELGAIASGLYYANTWGDDRKKCYADVPARDKEAYFIITTPFSQVDDKGNTRYLYFRIRKEQGQRLMSTVFEGLTEKYATGKDFDWERVGMALEDLLPITPGNVDIPIMRAIQTYRENRDFWQHRDIVSPEKVLPFPESGKEKTPRTQEGWVKVGELTGLSPDRIAAATRTVIPQNIYTYATGAAFEHLFQMQTEEQKAKTTAQLIADIPGIRRVARWTDPYESHRKEMEKAQIEAKAERAGVVNDLDEIADRYYREEDATAKQEAMEYINQQPYQERAGLKQRFENYGKFRSIPDGQWWLNLDRLPPEKRADVYYARWNTEDEEGKQQLEDTLRKIYMRGRIGPSILTFMGRLSQIRNQETQEENP